MRAREAKPRQVREMEAGYTLFPGQNALRTGRMPLDPFLGAVLPQPGREAPRSSVKHSGSGIAVCLLAE